MRGREKRNAAERRQDRRINRQAKREAFGEQFNYATGLATRGNFATVSLL
jgi:hypothetical protein